MTRADERALRSAVQALIKVELANRRMWLKNRADLDAEMVSGAAQETREAVETLLEICQMTGEIR
jgi:hypothetical protein